MAEKPSRPLKVAKGAAKKPGRTLPHRLDQVVPVKLPDATVRALDRWAKRAGVSRSQAIRALVEVALERLKDYAPIKDPDC